MSTQATTDRYAAHRVNARTGDTLISCGRTYTYCGTCDTWGLHAHPHADVHPLANRFATSGRYVLVVTVEGGAAFSMGVDTTWSDMRQDVRDSVTRENNAYGIVAAMRGVSPRAVEILDAIALH